MNEINEGFGTNVIKSTTYTVFTFVPLNLLHQLRNVANCTYPFIFSVFCAHLYPANHPWHFCHRREAHNDFSSCLCFVDCSDKGRL